MGNNLYGHIGGEFRYAYLQNNLQLSSGGSSVSFSGVAHVVHYDLILRTSRKNSPVQFFAAIGGGMKIFRGTGAEAAYQPLSQYGYFTKTQALKPMASVGGGMKYSISTQCLSANRIPRLHHRLPQGDDHSGSGREIWQYSARFRPHGGPQLRILTADRLSPGSGCGANAATAGFLFDSLAPSFKNATRRRPPPNNPRPRAPRYYAAPRRAAA